MPGSMFLARVWMKGDAIVYSWSSKKEKEQEAEDRNNDYRTRSTLYIWNRISTNSMEDI